MGPIALNANGDTLAVVAINEHSTAVGINDESLISGGITSGAVYLY